MDGDVRYAMIGDVRLAFRVRGGGQHAIVVVPGWGTNQDLDLVEPERMLGTTFERLFSFATVVSYDQRGTGLSDPVSLADLPTLEGWADDLHAVVTAAGLEDVVLYAPLQAGPVAALYATTRPERTRALILINSFAALSRSEDYEAGVTPAEWRCHRPSVPRHLSCTRSRTAWFPSSMAGISRNTSATLGWWNFPVLIQLCSSVRRPGPS
jgi:pimeloyl-ACP methyl ester carboxylesterase